MNKTLLTLSLTLAFNFQFSTFNCSAQDGRTWSTYYGATGNEGGFTTATDDSGNVYMAGITSSMSGMAYNGFQMGFGGGNVDAYLAKFTPSGALQWATYYGGEGNEMNFFGGKIGIATDHSGNVYLAGLTNSTTGISYNGFQSANGGTVNAYLVKFNRGGNRLWATYYGGTHAYGYAVATDDSDNVYMAGTTGSTTGIASNGFQNAWAGSNDAYLVKFDSAGNRLWGTYYGGTSMDEGYSVTTDKSGNVYLAGYTYTTTGMASGGFQNSFGGGNDDAFLVKFSPGGSRLWATYYGGGGDELFLYSSEMGIATDNGRNVYLTGATSSTTGIASNGFQNTYGGGGMDAYLVKFDSLGNRIWATYYGDADDDKAYNVATDNAGNVFIAGRTLSTANIASAGFQNTYGGGQDAFLVKFSPSGERLCATYYGMADVDDCNSVSADGSGGVYISGSTANMSGIAVGGYQTVFGGGTTDAMLVKFTSTCGTTQVDASISENDVSVFPNPFDDVLNIVRSVRGTVALFDVAGKEILHREIPGGKIVLNTENLAAGFYVLRVGGESFKVVKSE